MIREQLLEAWKDLKVKLTATRNELEKERGWWNKWERDRWNDINKDFPTHPGVRKGLNDNFLLSSRNLINEVNISKLKIAPNNPKFPSLSSFSRNSLALLFFFSHKVSPDDQSLTNDEIQTQVISYIQQIYQYYRDK